MSTTPSPLAQAIANAEGFGNGSAGTALNNPGDIFSGSQLAHYPTPADGWTALENQIQKWLNGTSAYANANTTIAQLAPIYTGNQNAAQWAQAVTQPFGLTPDATIGQLAQAQTQSRPYSWVPGWMIPKPGTNAPNPPTLGSVGSFLLSSRFVIAIIGAVLIAGGIFGFGKVHETVINTGKKLAETGAIAE